jgi:iron(III) transport system ATP-binding protein
MTAITVKKLRVRYGDQVALDRVDLEIGESELFLLLGPSGCGKTTLLRAMAGLTLPDEGAIFFGEDDVTGLPTNLRNVGMVFQSYALWPHLDVSENVAFGLRERHVDRREIETRVRAALASVHLGDHFARRVDELSGGEQQRVALARALVVRPRCLLLDEPLSNLDAQLRHSMRDEIRRVCREVGLTTVYVTHDQKEALAVADRIAVMSKGRILQVGRPAEVYRRPATRAVASFLGETNLLAATVVGVENGLCRVRTAAGDLRAQDGGPRRAAGERVWVSVRPECLSLANTPSVGPPPNAIAGELDRDGTTYFGEIAQHRVRANGATLRVYELNPSPREWAAGPLSLSVSPADVVLLPYDGDA